MYVASNLDREWLQNVQRKLYERSWETPEYVFRKLWGLFTDTRNLRTALDRVSNNRGRRTSGVDGVKVGTILAQGVDLFVVNLRVELRSGMYVPSPAKRVMIPKPGKPGKFRPLGIPTVKDRVVQAALKNILEPIFEADFYPISHGFRPGKSAHGALENLRLLMRPKDVVTEEGRVRRLPYQWVIEGDIKGCFDNISHHGLMDRIRQRVEDTKVTRLIRAFLQAGVMLEGKFTNTHTGTPQGGILSPLLANIALSVIEERYEDHVWPRRTPRLLTDKKPILGRANARRFKKRQREALFYPVRYADDFLILVSVPPGPDQQVRAELAANEEKAALTKHLKDTLGLDLSEEKTFVTPVINPIPFLGYHVRVRKHPVHGKLVSTTVIPKNRSARLRERVKQLFGRNTLYRSLDEQLKLLNPVLRGWCNFYRHAWGAKRVFSSIDDYVWWTIFRWLGKKHHRVPIRRIIAQYGWREPGKRCLRWGFNGVSPYRAHRVRVERFNIAWLKLPLFALSSMESPVRNERRTPGSVRGMRKPGHGGKHHG